MKKVFVADSFHSNSIAKVLKDLYGDDVVIFCDAKYLPRGLPAGIDTLLAMESEATAEQFENKTTENGVDLFFLSAKIILQGDLNPEEMKKNYGNPGAKVVAMSVSPNYLDDVKNGYGVDFLHDKDALISCGEEAEYLPEEEKVLLRSYLV